MMHEIGSDDDNNAIEHQQQQRQEEEEDVIDEVYTDYYVASSTNNNKNNDSVDDDMTTTTPAKEMMDSATATKIQEEEEEQQEQHEEECAICFETLSAKGWGRCTPCGHAFHKLCWWEWENAYNQRVDIRNRREGLNTNTNSRGRGGGGGGGVDEKCKCCLCNTINIQFIDGNGDPARNPSPYVAVDDPHPTSRGGSSGSSNRFTQFIRGMSEGANGFVSFMRNESNWNNISSGGTTGAAGPFAQTQRNSFNATGGGGRGGVGGSFRRSSSSRTSTSASGGGQQQQQQYYVNPYNQLRPGTQVILQNLARSPHLNKKHGTVLQYQAQTLRYLIQLETDRSTSFITTTPPPPPVLSIKAEHVLQPLKVQIVNLRTQPFYNGKVGTICAYIRPINRYVIKIESYSVLSTSSREISIQPCNIRIPNGTLVRLEGLEYASQWNGKYGTIVRFVEDGSGLTRGGGGQGTTELVESGRYLVYLSRQYRVLVKVENVRL